MSDELLQRQLAAGGTAAEDPAPRPPVRHFGDAAAEYRAATEAAAVFDLSDRTRLRLTGPAPAKFLNSYCTNDVARLGPGEGCEAFVTSLKGRVLAHLWIAVGEEDVRADTWPGQFDALAAHLGKYAMFEDVEIEDRTEPVASLCVCGPDAAEALSAADLAPYAHRPIDDLGPACLVQRVDWFRVPTFLVTAPRAEAPRAWDALATKAHPSGRDAFEALRIEAALPRYGVDLTDEHLAQEAARDARALSFTKGCYLGQEPIHRLHAMGHTNRELRVVRCETRVPPVGETIRDGDRELGAVTSSAAVPGTPGGVALAVLRTRPEPTSPRLADADEPVSVQETG